MGCCGEKRAALHEAAADHRTIVRGEPPITPFAKDSQVPLRYLQDSHIFVLGPMTHRSYEFSAANPVQNVAAGDAGEPALGDGV